MTDLPLDQVKAEPSFTYTGLDMLGPFILKEHRKELKRYGIFFTCLSSWTVNLEKVNVIETNQFIQALRIFIARKGSLYTKIDVIIVQILWVH